MTTTAIKMHATIIDLTPFFLVIKAALDASQRRQLLTIPIDRTSIGSNQITATIPSRYDGPAAGQTFDWTYGIGTYTIPGQDIHLNSSLPGQLYSFGEVVSSAWDSIVKSLFTYTPPPNTRLATAFGISDKAVEQSIAAGNTGALSAAAYFGKVFLYNGLNFFSTGFVGRQGDRYDAEVKNSVDGLPGVRFYSASYIDAVASIASLYFPGRAGAAAVSRGASWGAPALGARAGAEFALIQKAGELGTYAVTGYLPNGQATLSQQYFLNTAKEIAVSTVAGAGLGLLGSQLLGKFPALSYKLQWNVPTLANPLPIRYDPVSVSAVNRAFLGTGANPSGTIAGSNAGRTLTAKNGQKVELPNKESMTTEDAFKWLGTQSSRIPDLIKGVEGLQNQAVATAYWLNEFKIAMRQAMIVQEDVSLLMKVRSGPANLNGAISGNSGHNAGL